MPEDRKQTISGRAKIAGVAGWPVAHSRSPRLHNYWLARHGIDGAYLPFAIPPDKLKEALQALPVLGIAGMNLTLPHKQQAMALLDEIDDEARQIGAVNTIWVDENQRLLGTNTDAYGFWQALVSTYPGWRADTGPAVVVGAGGAARAVIVALRTAGVPEIRLVNRTGARAEELIATLGGSRSEPGARRLVQKSWEDREAALRDASLIVNTTNLGMSGQMPLPLTLDNAPAHALVYDIVYVPLETPLLQAARARGLATLDGLGMLLHQARAGFSRWFGVEPTVDDALRQHVLADLS